ncbi:MAG: hypothetical protein KKF56_05215 [Nanoarchaeota archaeon]|nr:hypothetical protein [Nanoarchaeota archaeon]
MELLKNNTNGVRIIIGRYEKGFKGIKKPTKTITILKTDVSEVYDKIMEIINNENK